MGVSNCHCAISALIVKVLALFKAPGVRAAAAAATLGTNFFLRKCGERRGVPVTETMVQRQVRPTLRMMLESESAC